MVGIEDSELSVDGYTMLRKDRIIGDKLRGGGVLLYVKNSVNVTIREDFSDTFFAECVWCDIEIGGEKTLVAVCYRPPGSDKVQDEALYKFFHKAGKDKHKLLIMGDFNYPELNWQKPESLDDSHPFLKCINDNFLIQFVENSTRGENVLDLVFASEENMIEDLRVGEPFGSSDHQVITWNFVASKERRVQREENKMHDYFKANYDQMREDTKLINWAEIVTGVDVEADWNRFKLTVDALREKLVPLKKLGWEDASG